MKHLKLFMVSILAILAPIKPMAIAALVVTSIDFILGVAAALKRGEKLTSSGLKQSLIKIFVYQMALMLGFLVQKFLIDDSIQLVNLISTLIGCTELKSAAENLEDIYGKPFLSQIISLLSKKQESIK